MVAIVCDAGSMRLRSIRPLGTFHARETRDGEARRRDGQVYVLMNELLDGPDERLVEVMFEDGVWMLVTEADLEPI